MESRRTIIAYKDYFNKFFSGLDEGTQDKVLLCSYALAYARPLAQEIHKTYTGWAL